MKTSCIQGQLLPSARAEAERRVEAATEVTGNSGLDQRISRGLGGGAREGFWVCREVEPGLLGELSSTFRKTPQLQEPPQSLWGPQMILEVKSSGFHLEFS